MLSMVNALHSLKPSPHIYSRQGITALPFTDDIGGLRSPARAVDSGVNAVESRRLLLAGCWQEPSIRTAAAHAAG